MAKYKCFSIDQLEDTTVVRLVDPQQLRGLLVGELQEELLGMLDAQEPSRMVIDFGKVAFCPSAIIDALIRTGQYGIYHMTNEGACSRFEFARRILERAGLGDVPLEPITSDQWPRASTPPLHCVIRNLAGAQLGITLPHWDEGLRAYFG